MSNRELPVVLWSVPCFDKRKEKPFPVYNRSFVLDWESLTEHQIEDVLTILGASQQGKHSPDGLSSSVMSLQRSPRQADNRMLEFRQKFVELADGELGDRMQSATAFTTVNLNREYFEDENGNEITHYEMIQHVSGQSEPIIVGDPDSILRLALSNPQNIDDWDESSANTIAQFLDVVRRICNSNWYRTPHQLTFQVERGGDSTKFPTTQDSELLEAVFPNDSETMSILAYFRQLHTGDRLHQRACDAYINTCGDGRKIWWMTERRDSFNRMIDEPPRPFNVTNTRREIIRMFMYGAGLLHANSSHGDDQRLADLIESNGKHRAVTIFNHCLHDFLTIAIPTYHVIKHEYDNWITTHGLMKPTRVEIPTLFEGFSKPPESGV